MFSPLKLPLLGIIGEIIAIRTVLESLEYDLLDSEILRVTPTVNTNGSLLKFEDTRLTKMKTKPVVLKSRIKSKFKANPLTKVRSNRAKNKSKTTIAKRPQKTKTKIKLKVLIGQDMLVPI